MPTRCVPGAIPIALAGALLVAACTTLIDSLDPTITPPPPETAFAIASPSVAARPASPEVSPAICADFFTPPPYESFIPVPGVTVRAIDKGHFEITNATSRTYYIGVTYWITEDNLVCGRGVVDHVNNGGRLPPGATIERAGGSSPDIPLTVSIWANPCGEGCNRRPLGQYVVPISSVEPPSPGST